MFSIQYIGDVKPKREQELNLTIILLRVNDSEFKIIKVCTDTPGKYITLGREILTDKLIKIGYNIVHFQIILFSWFCYVLLCNHENFHCLNHDRQTKDYITCRNKTEKNQ